MRPAVAAYELDVDETFQRRVEHHVKIQSAIQGAEG
jgi:hypothetical protein